MQYINSLHSIMMIVQGMEGGKSTCSVAMDSRVNTGGCIKNGESAIIQFEPVRIECQTKLQCCDEITCDYTLLSFNW